ncbi:GNAT family N-acetyltransferase [Aeromicrobium sp. P5_D10]
MSSGIQIRSAQDAEFLAVGELTVAGYDANGYLVRPDGAYDEEYATWLADVRGRAAGSTVLVAAEHGALLGTVTWCPHGSPSAQMAHAPHQGELRTLSVAPLARRRGIARLLVSACLDQARDSGLSEVLLCSLPEMTAAHGLYVSEGFARRPDLDWSPVPGVALWGFSREI